MPAHIYIARRLIKLPLVLLLVSIFMFGLSRFGGSPIGIYLHPEMTAAEAGKLEARFGLDKSFTEQYLAVAIVLRSQRLRMVGGVRHLATETGRLRPRCR